MRKLLMAAAGLLFTSLFLTNVSFSQDYAYHNPFPKDAMVDFMSSDVASDKGLTTVSIDANFKLQKAFNKQFKNAGKVDWYNLKKNYLAVFDYEGRKTRALFTKNGYNIYSIAYGAEKDLPKDYRKSLRNNYEDFEVVNAVEIHSSSVEHTTWLALLQNERNIVIARIIDGGMDEFARFDTSPKEPKKQRKGRVIIHKPVPKTR